MASVELVIKIPEEDYLALSELSEKEKVNELSYYERIIANGTSLPKGHGKLIDINALDKDFSKWCTCKCDCSCLICPVYNQKAIIEADTESED